MIYIFTALYCEALVFIRRYRLTRNQENLWFQEFYDEAEGIRLTVTGAGEIHAAAAVSGICSRYQPRQTDLLLNIGSCARIAGTEDIYLCNKITEQATEKTYYPDLLYQHDFAEAAVLTGMKPWNRKETKPEQLWDADQAELYDMEAAAVYQAGARFFGPHQMAFLKVVSDEGAVEEVTQETIKRQMEKEKERLFVWIDRLRQISGEKEAGADAYRLQEQRLEKLGEDLHCSKAMKDSLRQLMRYFILSGADYQSVLAEMYEKKLLPCKNKKEGKLRFEEFKKRMF